MTENRLRVRTLNREIMKLEIEIDRLTTLIEKEENRNDKNKKPEDFERLANMYEKLEELKHALRATRKLF